MQYIILIVALTLLLSDEASAQTSYIYSTVSAEADSGNNIGIETRQETGVENSRVYVRTEINDETFIFESESTDNAVASITVSTIGDDVYFHVSTSTAIVAPTEEFESKTLPPVSSMVGKGEAAPSSKDELPTLNTQIDISAHEDAYPDALFVSSLPNSTNILEVSSWSSLVSVLRVFTYYLQPLITLL